jgi:hypothetical protein
MAAGGPGPHGAAHGGHCAAAGEAWEAAVGEGVPAARRRAVGLGRGRGLEGALQTGCFCTLGHACPRAGGLLGCCEAVVERLCCTAHLALAPSRAPGRPAARQRLAAAPHRQLLHRLPVDWPREPRVAAGRGASRQATAAVRLWLRHARGAVQPRREAGTAARRREAGRGGSAGRGAGLERESWRAGGREPRARVGRAGGGGGGGRGGGASLQPGGDATGAGPGGVYVAVAHACGDRTAPLQGRRRAQG